MQDREDDTLSLVELAKGKELVDELKSYTPNKVVEELDVLSKRLPKL